MKTIKIILAILIVLTCLAAYLSNMSGSHVIFGILAIAALKFIGISFFFMDVKNAHSFWKGSIIAFLVLFSITLLIIL
ncbi:MAG: cytochrome C oxidase subunit IV family protein [Polaribacter sp.]|nr:cytochrome C oxidase subunit IV family protein [Polaribacter sp.]